MSALVDEEIHHEAGLRWAIRPDSDDHLIIDRHEPGLIEFMASVTGDVFLDVGAHAGKYAVRLAPNFAHVIAVEASPVMREVLARNIDLNDLANVFVLPVAAWHEKAEIGFECRGGQGRVGGTTIVHAMPLDDCTWGHVDLVKIDVEGFENNVLMGMRRIMATDRPRIVIEMHDRSHNMPEIISDVASTLQTWGYSWEDAYDFDPAHYWVCDPKDGD